MWIFGVGWAALIPMLVKGQLSIKLHRVQLRVPNMGGKNR